MKLLHTKNKLIGAPDGTRVRVIPMATDALLVAVSSRGVP